MFAFEAYTPCSECGVVVPRIGVADHVCNAEQRVQYQLRRMSSHIAAFERDFAAYLESPRGRFELWYARRDRLRRTLVPTF
jgi:hypothetical protein